MELRIRRIKTTPGYTLSRVFVPQFAELNLDLVEPPIEGLTLSPLRTFNPGIYKLFLKSDARTCSVLPVFQRVAQRPRLVIQPLLVQTHPEGIVFVDTERIRVSVWAGRMQGECLCPAKELFDRFVLRLAIAKQQREKITVNIL